MKSTRAMLKAATPAIVPPMMEPIGIFLSLDVKIYVNGIEGVDSLLCESS
jgi:hypothetical protein